MKIILDKCNSQNIMAAKLWISDGSRADPIDKKGIHQIVSSTMSRGCGPYNNDELAEIVESAGSILNCDTYEDGLLISLKCIGSDAYELLQLIGWMITKPLLETDQIELEKDLTIKALKRQKENPYQQAFDGWRKIIFKNGPYSHDPLGSIDNLKKLTKKDILEISNSLIHRNKTIVISGTFPIDITDFIKESAAFRGLTETIPLQNKYKKERINEEYVNKKETNICSRYMNTQQVVLLLGKATIPYSNKADLLLRLISCYLGYGMSSLLFKTLREKYGVVYEAGVYHPVRENRTPFIIHASTTEAKAIFTIKLLKECWEHIIQKEISPEELCILKTKYRGQIAHSMQSISQKAERKAHLIGIGLAKSHDETIKTRLKKITGKDIRFAANLYLKNPSLSICGKKEIAEKIRKEWDN